jgi:hypothetical protein
MGSPTKETMQNSTITGFLPPTRLVRKGSNFESLLCGLSPPVFGWRLLACSYAFCAMQEPTEKRSSEIEA